MPKILYVEDDPFIVEIYKKKFEASGLEAVNVATGKAALRAAKEGQFDLVLLDLVIPEMSGQEVLKELKSDPEMAGRVKVVVFSNLSSPEDRDECLRLGADGFIPKTDFTPSEVIEEVRRYLRQFSERERNATDRSSDAGQSSVSSDAVPKKKILFVEDEEIFVEMFGRRLRDEGYEVDARRDGASGLEAALKGGYDLLVSDIMLPSVSGSEIVTRLRGSDSGKEVPVILLSASVEADDLSGSLEGLGVARVFQKTRITPTELAHAVTEVLGGKG
ncbi:MAG: response regulator [Candidatus Moranbacteria bacterium]|nr:response regulator [Candidatus Moranbacteria bacterium]